jgi:plastocyanin
MQAGMRRYTGRALGLAAALVLFSDLMAAGKAHRVSMESMKYAPETLQVALGDTVTWTNRDLVPHTVSADKSLESGTIEGEREWRYLAKQKGRLDYICRFHPGMRGTLIVK